MTTDAWAGIAAAVLLVLAVLVQFVTLPAIGHRLRWALVQSARLGAAVALGIGIGWQVLAGGGWSPAYPGQVALALALAALLVHLILQGRARQLLGGPILDLVTAGLAVCGALLSPGSLPAGLGLAATRYAQWVLFLIGTGAVLSSGSAALTLAVRSWPVWQHWTGHWPERSELHAFLHQTAALATVAWGAGLAAGVWWSWHTLGSLTSGDPSETWIAAAALLTAASQWTARLGRRSGRWVALLAIAAAALAVTGLLAAADLTQLWA